MQAEERQQRISQYLKKVEFASLEELAQHVEASVSTVRRDITGLESSGVLRRTHGGARIATPPGDEWTFNTRHTRQVAEKEAIARACAALIQPNESVIIDVGTTAYQVAKLLEPKKPQIITNSLPVANLYAASSQVELVVTGGVVYPRLGVLMGPLGVEAFSKIHADAAIMGAGGVDLEGITNSHLLLIEVQRAMIKSARQVIFCLDHTKFGRKSFAFLCDLDNIDTIVTDPNAPPDLVGALRAHDIEVVLAK